jgi:hypothetical protein
LQISNSIALPIGLDFSVSKFNPPAFFAIQEVFCNLPFERNHLINFVFV